MHLVYDTPNAEKLEQIIISHGYTVPKFSTALFGKGKGRNIIKHLQSRPDIRSTTLVKICRALNISIDSLFSDTNNSSNPQTIEGSHNIINSNVTNTDLNLLRIQIESLQMLITEKDKRIEELKKINQDLGRRLDYVLQLGQNSDKK